MDVVPLRPELTMLRFPVGQAYLWRDPDGLTLIDAGPAGFGAEIAAVVGTDLRRIVVTHGHEDHSGSLAELLDRCDATVYAGRADAAWIRAGGVADGLELLPWETALKAGLPSLPAAPPARVDVELDGGETLGFAGGAVVVAIPGHTPGSIAVHLPAPGVLFTGDTVASHEGHVILGVFNVSRAGAAASFRRLAALDAETACFGHGDPVLTGASAALRAAAAKIDTAN